MILQSIRRAVGKDFPIDMRINGKDWIGPGQEIEEVARFLKDMSEEHLVDMVNISAGADIVFEGNIHMATHAIDKHMTNIALSRYVKEHVDIPVTVVGAIMTPDEAETVVRDGYADAVWLGRSLLADPDWVKKAYAGRPEDIRPCLRCLYCFGVASGFKNFGCSVNPRANKEEQFPVGEEARVKKRVLVVGGGTIGCELGIDLAEMGREVTIVEMTGTLNSLANTLYQVALKERMDSCRSLRAMTNTRCTEITEEGVKAVCADGTEVFLPVDRIILAAGMKSNSELAQSFYGIVPETYIIGDCSRVGKVKEATQDGFLFAANIE